MPKYKPDHKYIPEQKYTLLAVQMFIQLKVNQTYLGLFYLPNESIGQSEVTAIHILGKLCAMHGVYTGVNECK